MARKRKQKQKRWDGGKAAKSAARQVHFAKGGTLATWRGRPARFTDRRKQANKKACRGRIGQEG